jgi:tight adherence protein C
MLERIQHRLVVAGEPMTLNGFLTLQVLTTGAFLLLPPLLVLAAGLSLSPFVVIFIAFFAGVGLILPYVWLQQRVGQRRNQIIKNLPDSFDLITTCVEAGLGLDAALARVAEKVEGPFADELRRMLREISLGKMRRDALRELGERTGVPDLVSFVNAVIQAEEMGSSVGVVLRVQAEQLRIRRRQRAEQQAFQAPIKMIFPLVLCIFPTLFIVILGPAVITIMNEFSG